jgi:hypothetical protein
MLVVNDVVLFCIPITIVRSNPVLIGLFCISGSH